MLDGISYNEQTALAAVMNVLTDPALDWQTAEIMALIEVESGFRPHAVGSARRLGTNFTYGLLQLPVACARLVGFNQMERALLVPETNVRVGVQYLDHLWDYLADNLSRVPELYECISAFSFGQVETLRFIQRYHADGVIPDAPYFSRWAVAHARWCELLTG
jgi:hypothetical protein